MPDLTTAEVAASLERADILLTHGKGPTSILIRRFTNSHWSHTAMVFVLSDVATGVSEGYQHTFVLEAQSHGVDIHAIDKYLFNENKDMAVLRFPPGALPAATSGTNQRTSFLRRVRGFALERIDDIYGHGKIFTIAQRILKLPLLRPAFSVLGLIFATQREKAVNNSICSGVVQWAYLRACYGNEAVPGNFSDPFFTSGEKRRHLIAAADIRDTFDPDAPFQGTAAAIELTTPAHFAQAVRDGLLVCVGERIGGVWNRELTRL